MEIVVNKTELSNSLALIQNIVEKRNTMPILANILLSASDGKLKAAATDLEITASSECSAKVNKAGSTTVNAKVFYEVIRELSDEEITLKLTEGERLEISAGNSRMKIVGVSAEEYPSLPGLGIEVENKVNPAHFGEMISKTIYAVSADETRFNLSGVCFKMLEEEGSDLLRMVATDGHRLAMITRPVKGFKLSQVALIPRKGLAEVRKVLEGESNDIGVDVKEGFMLIETARAKLSMRLIDGEFPDYMQVLPKDEGVIATVDAEQLSKALKRVSLVVTDKAKGVKFDFSKDSLHISSSSPELGEANEVINDIKYDGEPVSVGFNARYLMDVAASLEEKRKLNIELHGELGPGKFFAEGDESYFAIVMPMRLV